MKRFYAGGGWPSRLYYIRIFDLLDVSMSRLSTACTRTGMGGIWCLRGCSGTLTAAAQLGAGGDIASGAHLLPSLGSEAGAIAVVAEGRPAVMGAEQALRDHQAGLSLRLWSEWS